MLTLKYIQDNAQEVIERLRIKNFNAESIIEEVLQLDKIRKETQNASDTKAAEANAITKEVGELYKQGKRDQADEYKAKTQSLKDEIKILSVSLVETEVKLNTLLTQIPNLPYRLVPAGKTPDENQFIRGGGNIPTFDFEKLPHWDLAKKYDIIDFELGNKLTGAGFPVYKGKGAKLQRALIGFFLDQAEAAGYLEVQPPIMVNEASGFGTGQLPDKEGQMYSIPLDGLYLIPTAEVPVTNIWRDVILDASEFPVKATAYSPCFRREAGSYGKDVRGLNRLHQFDKVEIVQLQHPDKSYEALEGMVEHVEKLVNLLELPYRIIRLCGGDMSFTSAMTYDFEVYSAGQDKWLEVSSVSNFETYQANRLKLRFKEKGEKFTQLAHTLNGSALALPRIVASLLENNQTPDGIRIPKVLQPYTGFDLIN